MLCFYKNVDVKNCGKIRKLPDPLQSAIHRQSNSKLESENSNVHNWLKMREN